MNKMDINKRILSQLTQEQQIIYTAMMMNPQQIPMFNKEVNSDVVNTGKIIKEMFDKKLYNKMRLDKHGMVVME
jgi:hypothetical protein